VPVLVVHPGIDQDRRPFEANRFVLRADMSGVDWPVDD
jgi:hypothetical protein